jgi:hypothetical protein
MAVKARRRSQDAIVQDGNGLRCGVNCPIARIFMDRQVPGVVAFVFNGSMAALQGAQAFRRGSPYREAGDTVAQGTCKVRRA